MKIAVFLGAFPTLTETWILEQLNALIQRGHDLTIFATPMPRGTARHPGVDRYRLMERVRFRPPRAASRAVRMVSAVARVAVNLPKAPTRLARTLNAARYGWRAWSGDLTAAAIPLLAGAGTPERFDLIHCHHGDIGFLGAALREIGLLLGPIVTTFHGPDLLDRVWARRNRNYGLLLRTGERFTVGSDFVRGHLVRFGAPPDRIVVLPQGLDASRFTFRPRTPDPDGTVHLLTIARLTEVKGIEYAIRAVAALIGKGAPYTGLRYQIVGEGPLSAHLRRIAAALGLHDQVQFLGPLTQDRVAEALGAAHLFVMPGVVLPDGQAEGQGVVLLEAQACGLPVIASRAGGIPENVLGIDAAAADTASRQQASALLAEPRDVRGLADAIAWLVAHPQAWPAMGHAGREFVEERFRFDAMMDRLLEVYSEVARRGG